MRSFKFLPSSEEITISLDKTNFDVWKEQLTPEALAEEAQNADDCSPCPLRSLYDCTKYAGPCKTTVLKWAAEPADKQ